MFSITKNAIDVELEKSKLHNPKAGAFVDFEGLVRNHNEGRAVESLEYEGFEALCVNESKSIMEEAKARYKVFDVACVHRVGHLEIGDMAVWVGATSAHRGAAFQACQYVIDQIKVRLPIWKKEHYVKGKSEWVNCQQCAHHGHKHKDGQENSPANLEFSERDYYLRQQSLPQVRDPGQLKLKNARVLVVGAGGLGSPALTYLAAAGVGTIGICDGDRVDITNLHRQTVYGTTDVGKYKAVCAKKHLDQSNPFIDVIAHSEAIDFENVERLVSDYDVVLDCTDNFKAKFLLHDVCFFQKKTLVQASVYQFEGQIQVYRDWDQKACMRCLWPQIPEEGCVGACVEVGVLGVVPGLLGIMQATETLKILLDLPGVADDVAIYADLISNEQRKIKRVKSSSCPLCGEKSIKGIAEKNYLNERAALDWEVEFVVSERDRLLEEYLLIDIRQADERDGRYPWEQSLQHLPGSEQEQFSKLEPGRKYLLVCEKGMRSRRLTETLRSNGHTNFFSLRRGMPALKELGR